MKDSENLAESKPSEEKTAIAKLLAIRRATFYDRSELKQRLSLFLTIGVTYGSELSATMNRMAISVYNHYIKTRIRGQEANLSPLRDSHIVFCGSFISILRYPFPITTNIAPILLEFNVKPLNIPDSFFH